MATTTLETPVPMEQKQPTRTPEKEGDLSKQYGDYVQEVGSKQSALSTKSEVFPSIPLIAAALDSTKGTNGGSLLEQHWLPKNKEQEYVIENLPKAAQDLQSILPRNILFAAAGEGADGAVRVNKLMKEHGLNMELKNPGSGIIIGSVLDIQGSWAAKKTTLQRDDNQKTYEAESVKGAYTKVNDQLVAQVYHHDGLSVYVSPVNGGVSGFDAIKKAQELTPDKDKFEDEARDATITLPAVSKSVVNEVPELVGMTNSSGQTIAAATQATKFEMNDKGFSAKQGLEMIVTRGAGGKQLMMNGDFMVWIVDEKSANSTPIFATVIHKQDCKEAPPESPNQ
jgi:hypothetical protein